MQFRYSADEQLTVCFAFFQQHSSYNRVCSDIYTIIKLFLQKMCVLAVKPSPPALKIMFVFF